MSHEDEIARLRSIMAAAADEIEAHWDAHCDGDGFGPVNLVRRLRTGRGDYRTTPERRLVVDYLRRVANKDHPIEAGRPMLSPAGRGLLLLMADNIARGEHEPSEPR